MDTNERGGSDLWAEMKKRLQAVYGQRLKGVVVFGSEAVGESKPDSDIDVMVLLDGPISLWEEIDRCVNATYPLALEIGRPIHPEPVDAEEYEKGDFALHRNAKAEGVLL
jgi:predicted nucleotidyltransferase